MLIRREEVKWRRELNEITLYLVDSKELIELNSVASEVWMLLNGENDLSDIVEKLYDEYKNFVDKKTLESDVIDLIEGFIEKKLVREK